MKKNQIVDILLTLIVVVYNILILFFSLIWIFTNSFSDFKSNLTNLNLFDVNENVTYGVFLSGALGGAFYCLRSLYQRIGEAFTPIDNFVENNNQSMNMRVWFFWYIYRPVQGGVLALILLVFVKSNLIQVNNPSEVKIESYFTMIGLSFLAGFGAHELIHKIQELIQVVFAKSKIKTSDSKQKVKENEGEE